MYYVYILRCEDDTLYTGITNDLARRLVAHKAGRGGRYTRAHGAAGFVYAEEVRTRSIALRREAAIKRLSRSDKHMMIAQAPAGSCYDTPITSHRIAMAKGNNSQRKEKKKPKKDKKK